MDEQHIKSFDLCERCAVTRICKETACEDCKNHYEEEGHLRCRCNDVRRETPCPYFAENEDLA
jgi:hypothetical protein